MDVEDRGHGNSIVGTPSAKSKVSVTFIGSNNVVEFGPGVDLPEGQIKLKGNDQKVVLEGDNKFVASLFLSGQGTSVRIGRGSRSNGRIWMNLGEAGDTVEIGEDCLFSTCRMRTSDSHPIYDVETGERVNPSGSIILKDRVWVAEDVLLLKGADIGADSIIGARALVTGVIPPNSLAVGAPAKVIRSGVRWQRRPNVDD